MDTSKLVVLDIETVGITASLSDLEDTNPRLATLWRTRAKWMRNRYEDLSDLSDEQMFLEKAPLHAEVGRVVCVCFCVVPTKATHAFSNDNEAALLRSVMSVLNNCDRDGLQIAGYNIARFDVPFLWKRMLTVGVRPPNIITSWDKKPWDSKMFDVAQFWGGGAWQETFATFDTVAACLDVSSPKTDMDGSMVHETFWGGGIKKVEAYCKADVVAVAETLDNISKIINS